MRIKYGSTIVRLVGRVVLLLDIAVLKHGSLLRWWWFRARCSCPILCGERWSCGSNSLWPMLAVVVSSRLVSSCCSESTQDHSFYSIYWVVNWGNVHETACTPSISFRFSLVQFSSEILRVPVRGRCCSRNIFSQSWRINDDWKNSLHRSTHPSIRSGWTAMESFLMFRVSNIAARVLIILMRYTDININIYI